VTAPRAPVASPGWTSAAVLLLAAWVGAALLAISVVAPAAFAVLPSRTLAGTMVGRVLGPLFVSGIATALAAGAATWRKPGMRGATVASFVAAVACAAAQFVVNPRIARLRDVIGGPVDALAADDARRVAFGRLHGYSVGGLGVAMLASAVALWIIVVALREGPRTA
jgi:hypothetical protein